MTTKIIKTEQDRDNLFRLIQSRQMPLTVKILRGVHRTPKQNRLQRKWLLEAAEQLQDQTAEEYRAYCKLYFGVPILRAENDEFCEKYDTVVKDLPYWKKLACMAEPFDFPITRLMNTKQKTVYLDKMYVFFTGLGVNLTEPESER